MKSKVMGVDAANRRKNSNLKVTASGGENPGANLKPMSKPAPMRDAATGVSKGVSGAVAGGGGKMSRPQPRPDSKMAPKSSPRPYTRTDKEISDMADHSIKQGVKYQKAGGKVSKMAGGGMCRGMGAAKKGGSYSKDG